MVWISNLHWGYALASQVCWCGIIIEDHLTLSENCFWSLNCTFVMWPKWWCHQSSQRLFWRNLRKMSGNVTNHVCKKSFRHRELIYVKFLLTLYLWICFCTSFCIKELGHFWKEFLAFQNRLKAHLLQVKKSCLLQDNNI